MTQDKQIQEQEAPKHSKACLQATSRHRRFKTIINKIKQLKKASQHELCILKYDPKYKRLREVYTHPSMRISNLASKL